MAGFKSYYTTSIPNKGDSINLSKEESHHLISVLRAKQGDTLTLFNGIDHAWNAIITEPNPKSTTVLIDETIPLSPPTCPITLAQAMPKAKGMDPIIRKATEIGVSKVIPLQTARTELKLTQDRQEKRISKWQTTAIEASKQSGNFITPQVSYIQLFKSFLSQNDTGGLKLIASLEPQAKPLHHYMEERLPTSITWLVGPEGDFTDEEYKAAYDAGFRPVSLATHVLRIETAVAYALSITDYELKRRASISSKR